MIPFIAGLGWTIDPHVPRLGVALILSALTVTLTRAFFYCLSRAPEYSNARADG